MDQQAAQPTDSVRLLFTEDGRCVGPIVFGLDDSGTPHVYVETHAQTRLRLALDDVIPQKRRFVLRDSAAPKQLRSKKTAYPMIGVRSAAYPISFVRRLKTP